MAKENHAFAVAVGDLRERVAKLELLIDAVEQVFALPNDTLGDHVGARAIALRLLVEAADTTHGMFDELKQAVHAMGPADA